MDELEDFLSNYPHKIRVIIDELSSIIFQTFPNIKEKIYPGWKGLGFKHIEKGYIVGIFPTQNYVKLGFEKGHLIVDKYNLFSDETKKIKYIIINLNTKIPKDEIKEYLVESVLV